MGPVITDDSSRMEYSAEDDKAIEQRGSARCCRRLGTRWVRARWRLKTRKVSWTKTLNVYGVQGLKLADLSVPPENVGANTGNTAFLVGEKAADIFIKELGLSEGQGSGPSSS